MSQGIGTGLCTAVVLGSCSVASRGAPVPALWLQPWQCLLTQLLSFSLASPAAPEAKHNTVSSAWCFLHPAPSTSSSASSQEQLGDSLWVLLPQPSSREPQHHPPRAEARLGLAQPGCSPGCCYGQPHIPAGAASWDTSWPQAQVPQPLIAKGSAGTGSVLPGGCCSSGAWVRRHRGMQDLHPPLLPANNFVCPFSQSLC